SILRAVPPMFGSQFPGVLAMGLATMILFFLPWLDRGAVKSIRYRGSHYKTALSIFVVAFLILGYLGTESTTVWGQFKVTDGSVFDRLLDTKDIATWVARVCTIAYFLFFFLMPWYTVRDKTRPVPERVTK
ncbi:MAG: cytochrome b, partial [Betaproteobacteria bacterium]|nr:cytochrome b [Betaproteobacteria bacterium]